MNLIVAAKSGWGKSFKGQEVLEKNLPDYEHAIVLDYKDEYRGLAKAGLAKWWIGGPKEFQWSPETWRAFLEANGAVVLARHDRVTTEQWREMSARVVDGARRTKDVVIGIDEAHWVAPQSGKVPDPITGLATTGRGEGASGIWITQRLAKAEEDVISQCQGRVLGGFESTADLNKVEELVEYPADLHNPQISTLNRELIADELLPVGRTSPVSLQKHKEDGHLVGSEWIYSDDDGERERLDTRGLAAEMDSTHYGKEGKGLKV